MSAATIIHDVFQPGLIRGAERLAYAPHKRYFYVQHPTDGWRVYLRSACFIHEKGAHWDPNRFIVVKRHGAAPAGKVWEPPKGQMEGKDCLTRQTPDPKGGNGLRHKDAPLLKILSENIRREVGEEAKINQLQKLRHTGLVYQGRERDYPDNHYFQYHVFQAYVTPREISNALGEFNWLHEHPKAWERLRKDVREKDAIAWYDPHHTALMGRWSPSIVAMYLSRAEPIPL
jgi:ADP-ribose pyrophosphatase YjhB (NUDIX family)